MVHVIDDSFSESDRVRYKEINAQLALENSRKDHLINQAYAENSNLRHQLSQALKSIAIRDVEIKNLKQQLDDQRSQNQAQMEYLQTQIYKPLRDFCENQAAGASTNNNNNNNYNYSSNYIDSQNLLQSADLTDQQPSQPPTDDERDHIEYDEGDDGDNETAQDSTRRSVAQQTPATSKVLEENSCLHAISERTENPSQETSYDSLEPAEVTAYIPSLRPEYHIGTPSIFNFDEQGGNNADASTRTLTPDKNENVSTPEQNNMTRFSRFSFLRSDQHSTPVLSPVSKKTGKETKKKRAAPELAEKVAQVTTPKRRYNLRNRK